MNDHEEANAQQIRLLLAELNLAELALTDERRDTAAQRADDGQSREPGPHAPGTGDAPATWATAPHLP